MKGQGSLSVSALTATFAVLQKTRPGDYDDNNDHDHGHDGDADEHEQGKGRGVQKC